MDGSERRQIDWASAEIQDGALTVGLTGRASKDWSRQFAGVVLLLGRGEHRWGEVALVKKGLRVLDVRQGAEEDLRHFLESVVMQVNSDVEDGSDSDEEATEAESEDDPEKRVDGEMSKTFQSFAEPESSVPQADG